VKSALDLGFDHFNFHRVFARCGADNQRSARLMKSIGMRLEAHYREHALFNGEWDEELHFAVLDREWKRFGKVREVPHRMVA
jgi:RimJ/RimL family protein N-acetyltransferase